VVHQTVLLVKDIWITEVRYPMIPFDIIITVNNIPWLYFMLPKSANLHFQLSNELCAADGRTCILNVDKKTN